MVSANGSVAYLQILRTTQSNDDYEIFYETACVRPCVRACVCVIIILIIIKIIILVNNN